MLSFQVLSDPFSYSGASLHLAGAGKAARPGSTRLGPKALPVVQFCSQKSCVKPQYHGVQVLQSPLHPACLRLFPLDYLLKSILMDFLKVLWFFSLYSITSFPTTPPQHFPSLVAGLFASFPCIKALFPCKSIIYTISAAHFA